MSDRRESDPLDYQDDGRWCAGAIILFAAFCVCTGLALAALWH